MRLPNWLKIVWWLALAVAVTSYLWTRYPDLFAGRAVAADVVVFLVWIALLLAPIFQEVELFGVRMKQTVEQMKQELKSEIHSVRTELRNAVDVRTVFSPQIFAPAPPPDSQLPGLEARIRTAVTEVLAAHGIRQPTPVPTDLAVDNNVALLFAARYGIEKELRRLARERELDLPLKRAGAMQISRALTQTGVIEPQLDHAIREVYAVSSAAVHAEDVSDAQVSFVREVGPELIGALRAISGWPT
jgi:hypothetical protein